MRGGVKRVVGTSPHPIEFSILSAVAVPLAIYFAHKATGWQVRLAAVLLCGLALVSMPGAVSRTGVIALGVALLVYMWHFKVREIVGALVVGTVVLVGYIVFAAGIAIALWGSITGAAEDDSIHDRIADYAQVSRTFQDHPLFGLGLGGAPVSVYGLLDNEWLQAIVQGGIVGVAFNDPPARGKYMRLHCRVTKRKNTTRKRSGLSARIDVPRNCGVQLLL